MGHQQVFYLVNRQLTKIIPTGQYYFLVRYLFHLKTWELENQHTTSRDGILCVYYTNIYIYMYIYTHTVHTINTWSVCVSFTCKYTIYIYTYIYIYIHIHMECSMCQYAWHRKHDKGGLMMMMTTMTIKIMLLKPVTTQCGNNTIMYRWAWVEVFGDALTERWRRINRFAWRRMMFFQINISWFGESNPLKSKGLLLPVPVQWGFMLVRNQKETYGPKLDKECWKRPAHLPSPLILDPLVKT